MACWRSVVALATTLAGCSHLTSRPPPPRPLTHPSECSDSLWPVVGDGYLAVSAGGTAALLFGAAALRRQHQSKWVSPTWEPRQKDGAVLTLVGLGAAMTLATAAFVYSGAHGVSSARACERARIELFQRGGPAPP